MGWMVERRRCRGRLHAVRSLTEPNQSINRQSAITITHIHTYTYTDTHIHTHTQIHTYTHTHTHTHIYTYTHTHPPVPSRPLAASKLSHSLGCSLILIGQLLR
eukprot:GHVU01143306.1.p1 GENE.GHVU01143306.1~~GHVU01143306.1.p1  ORF type:complete len:103 (-),score=4.08 GHVU01143306.1:197-505(-)